MSSNTETFPPVGAKTPVERFLQLVFRGLLILLILGGILFILNLDTLLGGHPNLPTADQPLSYALLFVAGVFTGFHCVGMCGALVVGYTVKAASTGLSRYLTHLYYGAGKTLSYTVIGGLFGALGAIVTFTPYMRGLAGIGAGIFLLLFGLSTLNVFPALARFRIKTPAFVMRRLGPAFRSNSNPFVVGLLNGLMIICGPLQAMYIMAAGTGQPLEGAKILFVFGLGTLPLMMGFGVLTSALSRQFAPKIVKASGIIVIALGVIMLNRGLAMVGGGYDFDFLKARWMGEAAAPVPAGHEHGHGHAMPMEMPAAEPAVQSIRMHVGRSGFTPAVFTLRKGVPVRWTVEAESLDFCTHRLVIPSLHREFDLHKGENLIEFTPNEAGVLPWSCWMGRLHGTFLVHDDPVPAPAPMAPASIHDHAHMAGHDHHAGPPPKWMQELLEKSSAAVDTLRRTLKP